jgi:hypothetical protein
MWVKVILIALVALVLFFAGFYVGRLQPELKDARATVSQMTQNQAKAVTEAGTINQEAATYAKTLADPAPVDAPHVSLCHYAPAAVPKTTTPRPGADEAPAVRKPDPSPPRDVGPPLVKIGRDSDAHVKALQDYITKICLR